MSRRGSQPVATRIDEPVELVPYDPAWPRRFAAEGARLESRITRAAAIEHIGSTAVPALAAKPVVDILVGVAPADVDAVARQIAAAGYEDLGEAGVSGRRHLRRRGRHAFNVHIVDRAGPLWRDNLALRDHLRRHAGERDRYARAKLAARAGNPTLPAYSDAKRAAVEDLLARARAEEP